MAQFDHSCSACPNTFQASDEVDGRQSYCKDCFRKNLKDAERAVLEDYLKFGLSAGNSATELFLDRFRRSSDSLIRKFAALKIFEELVLATEQLAMVYFALCDRASRPVLETLLHFELTPIKCTKWQEELRAADDQILERLGLTLDGTLTYSPPAGDPEVVLRELRRSISHLRGASSNRSVQKGLMVKGLNKLKHGFLAVASDALIKPSPDSGRAAVILYTDRQLGRLNRIEVDATEEEVGRCAETIQAYEDAARWLLSTYLQSQTR